MLSMIILFSLVFILGLVFLWWISYQNTQETLTEEDYTYVDSKWHKITRLLNQGDQTSLHQAVLEADKLVDHILQEKRVLGNTFVERLSKVEDQLGNHEAVYDAHRLRNKVVHDPKVDISKEQATKAIQTFYRALDDLGALKFHKRNHE